MPQALPQQNDIVNAALEYADEGVPVFPVGSRKTPVWAKGQSPNGKNGFHMASTDPDEVEALFDHPATRGIGMPTGKLSNCTVVDVDCGKGKPNRVEAVAWLEENRQGMLWGAKVVRTGSGGLHYYCKYTPGLKNAANVYALGIDVRTDGGYVVVPPFMGYKVERDTPPEDWPILPIPLGRDKAAVRRSIEDHSGATPPQILEMRDQIERGELWHDPVRDIVAHLVGSGWSDAEILRHVFTWTWPGFDQRATFEELCVMIVGAREKWGRDQVGDNGKTTDQMRLEKFAALWGRCSPAARAEIVAMIKEAGADV